MIKVFFGVIFILSGCGNESGQKETGEILIKTDKEFSDLSFEKGAADAFIHFAADDAILLRNDRTLYGIEEIKKYFNERKNINGSLIWNPVRSEISASGEIGYTFGEWKFFIKDSVGVDTAYGNYMSVWKKQKDGNWKYILDGGNSNAEKNQSK